MVISFSITCTAIRTWTNNCHAAIRPRLFRRKWFVLAEQPYRNHTNSGQLQEFGPEDGYLYIATGDGGSCGDPTDVEENLSSILGKLLG